MINICIPCLNNYFGLIECINSFETGTLKPDHYYVIDNGNKLNPNLLNQEKVSLIKPGVQLSLAKSWNWFIDNVPEIRILVNDDIVVYNDTLDIFIKGMNPDMISFPYGIDRINSFSFFSMPNTIVNLVGKFDEEFYPAYFEDNSYDYRLGLKGSYVYGVVGCNLIHKGSQTLRNYNHEELQKHHDNFRKNAQIYQEMWGGPPKQEKYKTKYNR